MKTHLGLKLLWSSVPNVLLGLRQKIARKAGVAPREGSPALRVRCLPLLAAGGRDPLTKFVTKGCRIVDIRPVRGTEWLVPEHLPTLITPPQTDPVARVPLRFP